jgi:hypothetical protein
VVSEAALLLISEAALLLISEAALLLISEAALLLISEAALLLISEAALRKCVRGVGRSTPPHTASQLAAPDGRVESTGALVGWTIRDEPPGIPAPGQSRCIGGPATPPAAPPPKPTAGVQGTGKVPGAPCPL